MSGTKNKETEQLLETKAEAMKHLLELHRSISEDTSSESALSDMKELKQTINKIDCRLADIRHNLFSEMLDDLALEAHLNLGRGKYELTLTPWELEYFIEAFFHYFRKKEDLNLDFFERPLLDDLSFVPNEAEEEKEKEKRLEKKLKKFEKENMKNSMVERIKNVVRVMQFNNEEVTEEKVAKEAKVSLKLVQRYLKYFA